MRCIEAVQRRLIRVQTITAICFYFTHLVELQFTEKRSSDDCAKDVQEWVDIPHESTSNGYTFVCYLCKPKIKTLPAAKTSVTYR